MPIRQRITSGFLLLLVTATYLHGQSQLSTAAAAPVRDKKAITFLQGVVAALGGAQAISAIQDSIAQGTVQATGGFPAGPVKYTNAWPESRYETPYTDGSTRIYASGHGHPAVSVNGTVTKLHFHVTMTDFSGHLTGSALSRAIANTNFQITDYQTGTDNGRSYVRISITDETDDFTSAATKQDWYFDGTTNLPYRVDRQLTDNSDAFRTTATQVLLSDYRPVSSVLLPFHIITKVQGSVLSDVQLSAVQFNTGVLSSVFDLTTVGGQ
jgi:hypothetical protein